MRRNGHPARRGGHGADAPASRAQSHHRPHRQNRQGRRLAPRRASDPRERTGGDRLRRRPGPPALALRAAQRRRAGGRDERAAQAGIGLGRAEGLGGGAGDEAGRRPDPQRQPHHPAARRRPRRHRGNAQRPAGRPELALRHGARGRLAVRGQRGCGGALPVSGRPDPHRRARRKSRRPARRHQSPLDQEPDRQPGRRQAVRVRGIQQQRGRERHGDRGGPRGHLGNRPGRRRQAPVRDGAAQPGGHGLGAGRQDAVDRRERTRRTRQRPRARLHDLGAGRRLLRLALQLFRPARRYPRHAATARPGGARHRAGLRAGAAHRFAGPGLVRRRQAARPLHERHVRGPARLLEPQSAQRLQSHLRAFLPGQAGRTGARRAHGLSQRERRGAGTAGGRGHRPPGRPAGGRRRGQRDLARRRRARAAAAPGTAQSAAGELPPRAGRAPTMAAPEHPTQERA